MNNVDPYKILGVNRDAPREEIQKAHRRLAKELHPDLNPGNRDAEAQFKEVSAAYDLLSDPEKRARFDRGEIDASGVERPQRCYYRDFADARAGAGADPYGRGPYASDAGFADFAGFGDADDILSELFGRARRAGAPRQRRGADVRYRLPIDFLEAANGTTKRVTLPDGSILDVTVPPGTRDGQVLRLRGRGQPGREGGPPGDALVEVEVRPHPFFTRRGDNIYVELPVSLAEAVSGARVDVPTPTGPVTEAAERRKHRHRASLKRQRCPTARRQPGRRIRDAQDGAAGRARSRAGALRVELVGWQGPQPAKKRRMEA